MLSPWSVEVHLSDARAIAAMAFELLQTQKLHDEQTENWLSQDGGSSLCRQNVDLVVAKGIKVASSLRLAKESHVLASQLLGNR